MTKSSILGMDASLLIRKLLRLWRRVLAASMECLNCLLSPYYNYVVAVYIYYVVK